MRRIGNDVRDEATHFEIASVWRRLIASLVDWIVAVVSGIIGAALVQVELRIIGISAVCGEFGQRSDGLVYSRFFSSCTGDPFGIRVCDFMERWNVGASVVGFADCES